MWFINIMISRYYFHVNIIFTKKDLHIFHKIQRSFLSDSCVKQPFDGVRANP